MNIRECYSKLLNPCNKIHYSFYTNEVGKILIISPHPDDETLGCGGIIKKMIVSSIRVEILLLTNGNSEIHKKRFSQNRKKEFDKAMLEYGDIECESFYFQDGQLEREPEIYRNTIWIDIEKELEIIAVQMGISLFFFQSNYEGDIVDFIQHNMNALDAAIINPASLSKTGYAILDALNANKLPFVEVHLSNIIYRGSWRADSIFSEYSVGCIFGFKAYVYTLGLYAINNFLEEQKDENISN